MSKIIIVFISLMYFSLETHAQMVWEYSFETVYAANAEDHLFSTTGAKKYADPITYWGTTQNNSISEVVYKFAPGFTIESGAMSARISSFDFGASWGESSLWGSNDGTNWNLLLDNRPRTGSSLTLKYGDNDVLAGLPDALTGTDELFIKAELQTFNSPNTSYSLAQWARDAANVNDVFKIQLQGNISAVPEPNSVIALGIIGLLAGLTLLRRIFLVPKLEKAAGQ